MRRIVSLSVRAVAPECETHIELKSLDNLMRLGQHPLCLAHQHSALNAVSSDGQARKTAPADPLNSTKVIVRGLPSAVGEASGTPQRVRRVAAAGRSRPVERR